MTMQTEIRQNCVDNEWDIVIALWSLKNIVKPGTGGSRL
jgi:hypothetical protein